MNRQDPQSQAIHDLIGAVRSRWRRLLVCRALARTGLAVALVLTVTLLIAWLLTGVPIALAVVGAIGFLTLGAATVLGLWPAREVPTDRRVARFIEERDQALDDRLVSAVDLLSSKAETKPAFASPLLQDAAEKASRVDLEQVIPGALVRRAAMQAAGAVALVLAVGIAGRDVARLSFNALSILMFPSRVMVEVTPGHARVRAGQPLTIEARLRGSETALTAQLLEASPDAGDSADVEWRIHEMAPDASGAFVMKFDSVDAPFRYRVVAGPLSSSTFDVAVSRPPRVTSIDLDYTFPAGLGLDPRTELDSGDIYAPRGTQVRLRINTEGDARSGSLNIGGETLSLEGQEQVFSGTLTVTGDASYRVQLTDAEGFTNPDDVEYFIRILNDRPPDVRVVRPARDRDVTPLEEVDVEAEAHDDFGLARMELVYAVDGGPETVVPLNIPPGAASASARYVLPMESLDVEPGSFVSYFVRAADVGRAARSSETRSDIFFLQVRPFGQEFKLVDSQGANGQQEKAIADLIAAQKEVIVATWKLDRRAEAAGTASEQDIRAVSRAESELKRRVEETSTSFRATTMRDPRRMAGGGGGAAPRAGQLRPEEAAMLAAAEAMGLAIGSLDRLNTPQALPHEMTALNHLLKAQDTVKEQEVPRQQAGNAGSARSTPDLSGLFDRELQRDQQTNYEMPETPEEKKEPEESALDRLRELARRQENLAKRQQDVGQKQDQMNPAELKQEIDRLAREQAELRQQAEQMSQQMAGQQPSSQEQQGGQQQSGQQAAQQSGQQQSGSQQSGQQQSAQNQQGNQPATESGQQSQSGQSQSAPQPGPGQQQGPQGEGGQGGQSGNPSAAPQNGSQQLRAASEEMRGATSDLQRGNARQAAERASRALEQLRQAEDRMQLATPDERRRALGEMQLEARQIADAQRQIGSDMNATARGSAAADAARRLAGEQERLADRARGLRDALQEQGLQTPDGQAAETARAMQQAAAEAAREIERQRLVERMQESANAMRNASQNGPAGQQAQAGAASQRSQEEVARALERLADQLAQAGNTGDPESRRLAEQLAQAQALRDQLEQTSRDLERLDREAAQPDGPQGQGNERGEKPADPSASGNAPSEQDLAELKAELSRQLQQTADLLKQVQQDDPNFTPGSGTGLTFEGAGKMVTSAPGTEAFKQDFAKWEELRAQVTEALERAGSSLSNRLNAHESRDRLASGADEHVPADYQEQVDSYFKAIAGKKAP